MSETAAIHPAPTAPDANAARPNPAPPRGPTETRILALDVVRGFAAFGILMVNIQTFGGPYPLYPGGPFTDTWSTLLYAAIDFAFVSKFFPLFSLLFGLGLAMQLDHAASLGESVGRFAMRRLGALFALGAVHLAFFSTIDILTQYALLGFVLVPLRRTRPAVLLGLAALALAVPVVLSTIAHALSLFDRIYPGEIGAPELIAAYRHGSLGEVFRMRLHEIRDYFAWVAFYAGWNMLAMILVGAAVVRAGFVGAPAALEARASTIRRIMVGAFALGIPAALTHAALWSLGRTDESPPLALAITASLAGAIGEPAMAIGYASALTLLVQRAPFARRLAPVANLGRLALSSYVLQSIVMSGWFFSYGLAQYGLYGPVGSIVFVCVVYACELVIAARWSRTFRFGPLEALWRAMTYGRWPAMRRSA